MNISHRNPTPTTTRWPAGRRIATLPVFTTLPLILLALALLPSAMAATWNWTSSLGGNWSDTGNWAEGTAPANNANTILNFGVAGTYNSANDISGNFKWKELNITAGTVTLSGSSFQPRNTALMDNTSGSSATIDNAISLYTGTGMEVHTAAGSHVTINGIISGSSTTAPLIKTGTGTLVLGGANSFAGGLFIQRGTVASGGTSQKVFGYNGNGAVTLGDASVGANVALVADYRPSVALANPITVAGGAGTRTIQANHTSGTLTFSGAITLEKDVILDYTSTAGTSLVFSGNFSGTGGVTLMADGSKPIEVTGNIDSTGVITNSGSGTGAVTISGTIGYGVIDVVQNSATSPMILSAYNSYPGGTKVLAGTLTLSQPYLDDSSVVSIASGATLDLTHANTDVVGALITNGVPLPGGIYDSNTLAGFITGPGAIEVVTNATYTLTYNAGPNGSISGTTPQIVAYGADGSPVTAVPNLGYHFTGWSDGSTNNPRTDTHVVYNITVTANFAPNFYTLIYVAGPGGTINGVTTQVVAHAADGTTVTAAPDSGYHFVNWSDGVLTKARQELNVTGNTNVTANFAIDDLLTWAIGNGTWDTSSLNWTNSGGTMTNYNIADLVRFNDNNTGGSEIAVTLNSDVNPTWVTVSNSAKNYTIAGSGGIFGTTGLDKDGAGSLTLIGTHTYTGKTTVTNGGTLRLGDGSFNGAIADSKIAISTNTTLAFATPPFETSTCNGVISGEGNLVKTGGGTAVLAANETYTGGTLVSDGTLQVGIGTSAGVLKGDLTNNATVHYYRSGSIQVPALHGHGTLVLEGTTTAPMMSGTFINLDSSANTNFTGTLSAAYARIGGNNGVTPEGLSAASPVTAVTDATLWLTNSGSGPFTNHFVIAGDGFYNYIAQEGVLRFQNAAISGTVTMQGNSRIRVDTGCTGEISGVLEGDYVNLEVGHAGGGTGLLLLSGTNTYSGNTTISSGTLALSGTGTITNSPVITVNAFTTLDASAVTGGCTLGAAQTLKGDGTVIGPLTHNGTLTPGLSDYNLSTLTFSNDLVLAGTCVMEMDTFTTNSDIVSLTSGTLTYGGTLTVQNLGGPPAAGMSFKLFSAGAYSSNFTVTNLPALAGGLEWRWTPANGTLKVVVPGAVDPTPTNITYSVSGNVITLTWPESHTGWTLQWQTNSLAIGLSTNWNDVPDSSLVNQVVVTNNPADPPTFYRLRYDDVP